MLVLITLTRFSFANRVKDFFSGGFIPFIDFSTRLQESSRILVDRFKDYSSLQIENTELKRHVGELSAKVAQISELERENREFRSMLDFRNRSDLKLIPARVIARDPSNWWQTILIDRGSTDGLTKDMPVLTVEGLVGKTIEVAETTARVLLITDENCKVPGWLRESALYGIIQGSALAGGVSYQCRMTFLTRGSQVKQNDQVFTSGLASASNLDAVFPKGIVIGTVASVQDVAKSVLYQEVCITPAVDLAHINEVFVGMGSKSRIPATKPASPAKETPPPRKP